MAAVSRDQPTSWRAVLSLVPVMRIASMTRKYGRDVVPSAYKKCSIDRVCDDCAQRCLRALAPWLSTHPGVHDLLPLACPTARLIALRAIGGTGAGGRALPNTLPRHYFPVPACR
jgi:hypothetical protein